MEYYQYGGLRVLSLCVNFLEEKKPKEIQVISLEQIIAKHLRIPELGEEDFHKVFMKLQMAEPEKYVLNKNTFVVKSPNNSDITRSANGKSSWFLVRGIKGLHKQVSFLFLGQNLWGVEYALGLQMKRSTERGGKEKIVEYLYKQVHSILTEPDSWVQIQGHCLY